MYFILITSIAFSIGRCYILCKSGTLPLPAVNDFETLTIEVFKSKFNFPFDSQFSMGYLTHMLQEDLDVVQTT